MQDDYLSATWASHHGEVSRSIHKFFKHLGAGMARLNRRQFDAPWRRRRTPSHPLAG